MLQIRSFTFDQEKEINEVLKTYRLAKGSSVFVSEGKIMLPIENGEPMNLKQKLVKYQEDRNTETLKVLEMEHSLKVVDTQITVLRGQIASNDQLIKSYEEDKTKSSYDKSKELRERNKQLQAVLQNFENTRIGTKADIDRANLEIKIYSDVISDIEDEIKEGEEN